jgi:hypothetical protein
MKIELDWCHLQAGTADHLLENPSTQINYIETCWIMSIRDFLRMYNVRLEFTEHSHPVPLCESDEFIMDAMRLRGQCTPNDMQRLNACRMHLRVCRLLILHLQTVLAFDLMYKGEGLRDSPLCSQVAASSETTRQGLDILELQASGSLLRRREVPCPSDYSGAVEADTRPTRVGHSSVSPKGATRSLLAVI